MTTTATATRTAPADVDGYVQQLPVTQLTATELYREEARLGRLRGAMTPGTPERLAVIERQQDAHAELHHRLVRLVRAWSRPAV